VKIVAATKMPQQGIELRSAVPSTHDQWPDELRPIPS
jgi:hypothetical protein